MVERILVTGASGTVGSEVINQLSSDIVDVNIRAAAHSIESVKKVTKSESVEPIQIDYNNPDTLKDALKERRLCGSSSMYSTFIILKGKIVLFYAN